MWSEFKKTIALVTLTLSALLLAQTVDARQVNVRGYYRKNGTYVAPHVRNISDSPRSSSSYSVPSHTPSSCSTPTYTPRSYSPPSYPEPSYNARSYIPRSYRNPSTRATTYQRRQEQGSRTFSKSMKEQKYQEQNGMCPHCGRHCDYNQMEGDHIVPYSKGGKTDYSNLQMLCAPCNRSKGNRYSY